MSTRRKACNENERDFSSFASDSPRPNVMNKSRNEIENIFNFVCFVAVQRGEEGARSVPPYIRLGIPL